MSERIPAIDRGGGGIKIPFFSAASVRSGFFSPNKLSISFSFAPALHAAGEICLRKQSASRGSLEPYRFGQYFID